MEILFISVINSATLSIFPSSNPKEGDTIILSCIVDGSRPLSYQWLKEDIVMVKESESFIVLNDITRWIDGSYTCVALNMAGSKSSEKRIISVNCKYFGY